MKGQVNDLANVVLQLLTTGDAVPHRTEASGLLKSADVHVWRFRINGRTAVAGIAANEMPAEPFLVRSALAMKIAEYMVREHGAETARRDADGGFRTGRYDPVEPVA